MKYLSEIIDRNFKPPSIKQIKKDVQRKNLSKHGYFKTLLKMIFSPVNYNAELEEACSLEKRNNESIKKQRLKDLIDGKFVPEKSYNFYNAYHGFAGSGTKVALEQWEKEFLKYYRACETKIISINVKKKKRLLKSESAKLKSLINEQDGDKCHICGCRGLNIELHLHHIIPLDQYGTNHINNFVILCFKCHQKQHPFQISKHPHSKLKKNNSAIEMISDRGGNATENEVKSEEEKDGKKKGKLSYEEFKNVFNYHKNLLDVKKIAKEEGIDFNELLKSNDYSDGQIKLFNVLTDEDSILADELAEFNKELEEEERKNAPDKPFELKCNKFIAIDIETTGLSAKKNEIIEIAAVRFQDGKVIDTFSTLVNQNVHIPQKVTELTGITNSMLQGQPSFLSIRDKFVRFIGKETLVFHNAPFEVQFLKKYGIHINNDDYYDTLKLARKKYPRLSNHQLPTLIKTLNIDIDKEHRALDDARATGYIFIETSKTNQAGAVNPEKFYSKDKKKVQSDKFMQTAKDVKKIAEGQGIDFEKLLKENGYSEIEIIKILDGEEKTKTEAEELAEEERMSEPNRPIGDILMLL